MQSLSDIQYEDLNPINKEIVLKHYKIAGAIDMWNNIKTFLIEQVHRNKSIVKRKKYTVADPLTKYYYDKYLFRGQKQLTGMDPYPCYFKSYLEDFLVSELNTKRFNYVRVYYSRDTIPDELKFDSFNREEWIEDPLWIIALL
ncbi:Hypothetical protein HVR_LOCUS315 [uncultured virus]|nr:Hypothetical protein HVR_LOCUS315 [uncultured virus]